MQLWSSELHELFILQRAKTPIIEVLETIYELLPKRLVEIREKRNLTQPTAAELCGLELRTYQAFEYGQRFPRKAQLLKLCGGFGVDQDYFCANGVKIDHALKECRRRILEALDLGMEIIDGEDPPITDADDQEHAQQPSRVQRRSK